MFVLLFLVMYLFLQNFRATLIPAVTIPVSVIASFVLMALHRTSAQVEAAWIALDLVPERWPNAIYMETSGAHAGMKDGTVPAPEAPGMSRSM